MHLWIAAIRWVKDLVEKLISYKHIHKYVHILIYVNIHIYIYAYTIQILNVYICEDTHLW
jgi:hypothetical protein